MNYTDANGDLTLECDPSADVIRLKAVATFGDPVEASILRGRLEQAGIEACVPEELSATAFGGLPLNPVTVRVAQQDLAAAQAILAASTEA